MKSCNENLKTSVRVVIQKRLLILFFYCFVFILFWGCSKPPQQAEQRLPVTIGEAIQQDAPLYLEAIGNVYSLQTVEVRPQVGGIILEAYVKQGQFVKKGEPLYLIDPRPYQADLEIAKGTLRKDLATLKFDTLKVERYAELAKQDYFSKINYEQFLTSVEGDEGQIQVDKGNIALAEINLEWCTPKSPMDGKISQYNIDPGNLVTVNDPNALTTIRLIDPADIRFGIPQKAFVALQNSIRQNQLKLEVFLPQDPDHPREGKIYFIDNNIDLSTGTILIKGTVPNEDEFFWPGEFIRVRLQLKIIPNAILVPEEAVGISQTGSYVYIYHPETSSVEYRPVVKGHQVDKMVIIAKGVEAGEKIVLTGQLNLRPGSKVFLAGKPPINGKISR